MSGITIDLGQMVTAEAKAEAALAEAKAVAKRGLLEYITAARSALVTTLPAQDMIYLAKEAEAAAWVAADAPDLADYPLLSAEVGISAPDADQLAQLWLNMSSMWRAAAAQLEALRLSRGAQIDAAETPEAALALIADLT